MIILSFIIFVFFKTINNNQNISYLQHLCISSYISLFTIIYSLIFLLDSDFVRVLGTGIYVLGCGYLHVNLYKKGGELRMWELVGFIAIVGFFYIVQVVLFY